MILTGRRVALLFAAGFVVMLIPNIVLMVKAIETFSGLVVPNSYVASQSFDRNRAAQQALGWQVGLSHDDGALHLDLADAAGDTVRPASLGVVVGRPTTTRDDVALALVPTPTGYAAETALAPGRWRVEIAAVAADGTSFRQSRDILVP